MIRYAIESRGFRDAATDQWVDVVAVVTDKRAGIYTLNSRAMPVHYEGDRLLPRSNPSRARILRAMRAVHHVSGRRVVRLP